MPSPSRDAEIWYRKKIFQLQYRHFIKRGFTDLITPRVFIVKAIVDIRVVWNSKSNGHNTTLWAPGFMLGDIGDIIEMVTKWLAVLVADYFDSGLPLHDYTLSTSAFIKSKQGNIDVGAMFNNFHVHLSERHCIGCTHHKHGPGGGIQTPQILAFLRSAFWGAPLPVPGMPISTYHSSAVQR
jgi:hypothetical protein